jgi:hypothetical protein
MSIDEEDLKLLDNPTDTLSWGYIREQTSDSAIYLGLEIEVAWSSFFPNEYQEWFIRDGQLRTYWEFSTTEQITFSKLCTKLDARMYPILQELTLAYNLAVGKDAYHEFVLPPMQNPEWICKILRDLTKNGWLPHPVYQPHSLHITLGELTEGEDFGIFIIALEILSGVTPARIHNGIHTQDSKYSAGWARRGSAGYKVRPKSELSLGANTGIEIRTLILPPTLNEQQDLIYFTSLFGTYLLNPNAWSPLIRDRWLAIKSEIEWVLKRYHLPKRESWWNPSENPETWAQYGKLLEDQSMFLLDFLHKSLV